MSDPSLPAVRSSLPPGSPPNPSDRSLILRPGLHEILQRVRDYLQAVPPRIKQNDFDEWTTKLRALAEWARAQFERSRPSFVAMMTRVLGSQLETARDVCVRTSKWISVAEHFARTWTNWNPFDGEATPDERRQELSEMTLGARLLASSSGPIYRELVEWAQLADHFQSESPGTVVPHTAPIARPVTIENRAHGSPPSDGQPPTADSEPAGRKVKGKGINEAMLARIAKDPECKNWPSRRWANVLGCSPSTVCGTRTWRSLEELRAQTKAEFELRRAKRSKRC